MNLIHKAHGIWDYDKDCRWFIKFLDKKFKGKYACGYEIYEDDGSYNPPSGSYVQFSQNDFYLCATDLITIWQEMNR